VSAETLLNLLHVLWLEFQETEGIANCSVWFVEVQVVALNFMKCRFLHVLCYLLSVRYVVLDVKRKWVAHRDVCLTGVLHSSTSEVAAWVIGTNTLHFQYLLLWSLMLCMGLSLKIILFAGECVQRECALAGGIGNVWWLFLYWNELYSVLFISLCACRMLLFYVLLHASETKMSFSKESNETNVSVERFNLELACVEAREQYEIVKICQNLYQRVWTYGTMRQRKVPCLIEELGKLTEQRKWTKLHFFKQIWAKWMEAKWTSQDLLVIRL
jgi:hypothetical protein